MGDKQHSALVARLRRATPAEQVAHLRAAIADPEADKQALTDRLVASVAAGAISPPIINLWLSVARDPRCNAAVLRQPHSAAGRRSAIKRFAADLRHEETFAAAWAAVGGSPGLVALLNTFSVRSVHQLCKELGRKPTAPGALQQRRQAMTDLFTALGPGSRAAAADERPLRNIYRFLLPACIAETGLQWDREDSKHAMRKTLSRVHPLEFGHVALEEGFPQGHGAKVDMAQLLPLVEKDISFGLHVLGKLSETETLGADPEQIMTDLIIHLARRCDRHCTDQDASSRLWALIAKCLRRHQALREYISLRYPSRWTGCRRPSHGLLFFAVRKWVRPRAARTEHDDAALAELIGFMPATTASGTPLLHGMLKLAPPAARYQLLRLFFQNAKGYCYDLGAVDSIDAPPQGFKLGLEALLLPPHEALCLVERLLAFGQPAIIPSYRGLSILQTLQSPNHQFADPHILRAHLLRRAIPSQVVHPADPASVLEHLRSVDLSQRRKQAEQGRFPEDRSFWAASALSLALAIGDINLYGETLLWARRYIKDPLVSKEIFATKHLLAEEVVDLLCVLPRQSSKFAKCNEPHMEEVVKANRVLLWLLECATLALREPSFNYFDWLGVFRLVRRVVHARLYRVDIVQDRYDLSDAEVFDTIWKPTIVMIVEAETMMLHPGLKGDSYPGCGELAGYELDNIRPPTMKFLDALAEARDTLWAKRRVQENTSVMELRWPWPRGLTVQCFLPHDIKGPVCLPYIESRAKAVVFGDRETYLAPFVEDMDTKEAIGKFVDSWTEALKIYLQGATADGRAERVRLAWAHAVESLSQGRMTLEEAFRFWKPFFTAAGVDDTELEEHGLQTVGIHPAVPLTADPSQPVEWNPDSMFATLPAYTDDKELTQTCLDILLQCSNGSDKAKGLLERTSTIFGLGPREFWSLATGKRQDYPGSTVDAFIVAAMLYMNSHRGADTSLMMRPFPSAEEARFPAVYLEQDFLERKKYDIRQSDDILSKFHDEVPVALLAQLASSLLQRAEAEENAETVDFGQVVRVVKLVSNSDDPTAASSIIQHFLMKLPRESAWHRILFNGGLLRSLPPRQAQDVIQAFASSLFENLQSSRNSAPGQPRGGVKVTTVKMLAQVLKDAAFVTPRFSVSVLAEVLHRTKHVDIRAEALASLISTAKSSEDAGLRSTVFDLLRQYAVPMASSLNEQQPETEADWQAAEESGLLPEVLNRGGYWPRLLSLLVKAASGTKDVGDDIPKNEFLELLYEALQKSAEVNQRWIHLFLKTHGFDLPENESLPQVPSFCKVLGSVSEITNGAGGELFDNWKRHILVNLNPGPGLARIIASVKSNRKLSYSNAGEHWLSLWDNSGRALEDLGFHKAVSDFAAQPTDGTRGVVPSGRLEEFMWEMVDVLLAQARTSDFQILVSKLADTHDPCHSSPSPESAGRREAILQRVVDRINALRTPQWQADPHRKPVVLPDTLPIKLNMVQLLHPEERRYSKVKVPLPPKRVDRVFVKIVSLIDEVAGTEFYHDKFSMLMHAFSEHFYKSVELAVRLGSPESVVNGQVPSLADCLRVDLAADMLLDKALEDGKPESWCENHARQFDEMFKMWLRSTAEHIRKQAWRFKERGYISHSSAQ